MKSIGIIPRDRLVHMPRRYHARHEFCFHLHDLMVGLLVQMESTRAGDVKIDLAEGDQERLDNSPHVLDFLAASGRGEIERRIVVNHMAIALYADLLHFVYEALRALEKRKFAVAFSLLRKPFKESLLIAAQICVDETALFAKLKSDAANLLNRRELDEQRTRQLLKDAISVACKGPCIVQADTVYDTVFDRKNALGLAGLFDKATHLITENSQIRTENYNINFIFKNPSDDDVYSGETYQQIAMVLQFLALMQINLYGRMTEISRHHRNWLLFTSLGTFEALFASGSAPITRFVRSAFGELLKCGLCEKRMRLLKTDAPRFFIAERIECSECGVDQGFPFGWLLSQFDINVFDEENAD
ncbi:hypothetical protein JJJ17_04730 [Paracoccus caeni]|uniref:Uncharacterized protein n=1 Tax=Paracoccus caeni TaxID=657651 RepID=A0A934SAJ2_9RHOB|nr:hypothetical protein [Paracoccus caeni]MBK4215226.1 hypothetical protein [Paracoccus caeni]